MSQYTVDGSLVTEDPVRLTGNTATPIYTATTNTPISSVIIAATSGTPTAEITITTLAGTTRTIWKAATPYIFNELFTLYAGYVLKVTSSSASGDMDVTVTHGVPAAANQR